MARPPRIGLLPLYLKLYDDCWPELRGKFVPLLDRVSTAFEAAGIAVSRAPICRLADEFAAAVAALNSAGVDLVVALHLAYSPSEEAIEALCGTQLPLLLLDTTMDPAFGQDVDPERILYNHGIHGVQDLASLLRRRRRPYRVVAGHAADPALIERAAGLARAAAAAREFASTKALRIGDSFRGMGDFAVTQETFERVLGLRVDQVPATDLASEVAAVTPAQIEAELRADVQRFTPDIPAETHRRSVRVGLGLRQRLDGGGYSAFSLNFLAFDTAEGPVDTVPFLEASKAMARGLGYAGEGDVLTAALVGALNRAFGRTTFTEIFCPDWAGNALFLSHMGEINPEVVGGPARLCERPFPFTKAQRPAIVTGAPRPGPATLVNLSPGPDDTFRLLIVPVEVLADTANPAMRGIVRGWIRPSGPVPQFLERYSELGGTHHSALVLGHHTEALTAFAEYRGWEPALVG